jgi:heme-degrading monooxygenase HmoA
MKCKDSASPIFGKSKTMIVIIFEAIPAEGQKDTYLDIAASLKPELTKIAGFISIERFQSLTDPSKVLSLSFWTDEASVRQWRNLEMHREAQIKGRSFVFSDYRLRVAGVIRDYGMFERNAVPIDSKERHQG